MFVPLFVILGCIHLVSCFVSYQPEQVHLAYGGSVCILLTVERLELSENTLKKYSTFDWCVRRKHY
jgi:hypothetical protein